MPFERFMEQALYHPIHGFFGSGQLRSVKAGDFLTSPEVSPLFGETLGRFISLEHERLGEPFKLIEVGAGSGSLLGPLLASLDFQPDTWAVERSPAARQAISDVLSTARVVDDFPRFDGGNNGVIIANELLDNLPMALAVRDVAGWFERWVGASDGDLVLVDSAARPSVAAWCEQFAGNVPEGGLVEVQLAACEWVESAISVLSRGWVLIFDYGDTAEGLLPRRTEGTLRTYRSHHLGPHPLDEPGATDITADVNFTALASTAEMAGCRATISRQDDFLAGLGLRDRLSDLRNQELAMARSGNDLERLAVRSQKTEVETLLHPRGLGDFRVMAIQVGN